MRKTVDEKKRELIDDLAAARRSVLDAALAFPLAQRDDIFLGTWSIKDLLAHLIGWDWTNTEAIEEILDGKYPNFLKSYDKDWKTYNEQLIQKYRKTSFDELLRDVEASHQRFISFLDALPAGAVVKGKARSERGRTVTIANLLKAEAADEHEHAAQMRAFLQPQVNTV